MVKMSFQHVPVGQQVVVESQDQRVDFRLRKCSRCDGEVLVDAGDVLYGEEWYHAHCWQGVPRASWGLSDANSAES
jgi:hypothetical protein